MRLWMEEDEAPGGAAASTGAEGHWRAGTDRKERWPAVLLWLLALLAVVMGAWIWWQLLQAVLA